MPLYPLPRDPAPRLCPCSLVQSNHGGRSQLSLATDSDADPKSIAQHLKADHVLPDDAVDVMDQRGVDLRDFHNQEHDNDAALGLSGSRGLSR